MSSEPSNPEPRPAAVSSSAGSPPTSAGRTLRAGFVGSVPYERAFELQIELREALKKGEGDEHLLLLEHPHVYTLGRNAAECDLLAPPEWLEDAGVEVVKSDRGGQVTYHGPGQLVGYPILNLSPDRKDIRRYVRDLQAVLAAVLADYGIEARGGEAQQEIGVWAEGGKIASIGVHLSRWHTTHGFALNVTTELVYFQGIIPCGLPDVEMTSIEALTGRRPSLEEVARRAAAHMAQRFERRLAPLGEGLFERGER